MIFCSTSICTICSQQRIFAVQVFELHRVIEVSEFFFGGFAFVIYKFLYRGNLVIGTAFSCQIARDPI